MKVVVLLWLVTSIYDVRGKGKLAETILIFRNKEEKAWIKSFDFKIVDVLNGSSVSVFDESFLLPLTAVF